MSITRFLALPVSVLVILSLAACSFTGAPAVVAQPTQAPAVPLDTQVAEALASTAALQTAVANALASTQAALATVTPQFTFTPSLTPIATFTLTSSFPTVSVSFATNCRSGPTTAYNLIGVLYPGQTAQVVGRSLYTDTMIIKMPTNPAVTCWLWAKNAKVVGDISKLPLIAVPPSPTPASVGPASFTVTYVSTIKCSGNYKLKFRITNTGSLTWESNSVKAIDSVTSEEHTVNYDDFPNLNSSCSLASDDLNLTAGEAGTTASGAFSANPAGHNFKATIHVCSSDGMADTCLAQSIAFTP